jgi:hypothetical protein
MKQTRLADTELCERIQGEIFKHPRSNLLRTSGNVMVEGADQITPKAGDQSTPSHELQA